MRLIDADALLETLNKEKIQFRANVNYFIMHAPTVDAEPVRHGHWEVVDEAEPRRWGCSNCRCLSWHEFYYCPNCGAKMDEVENEID